MTDKTANIHRFRDFVALYVANGETVYLTPGDARKLADALHLCAGDIEARDFVKSEFPSTEMTLAATRLDRR